MSYNFSGKKIENDFSDILETSDYNDYLKFCTQWGPLYAKSFSFFMLTNFFFFSLLIISKWFLIMIFLNMVSWHNNMQMDWDEAHGQLDDNLAENDNELDPHTFKPLIDPFVLYFYIRAGFISNDFRQLTTYSYIISLYDIEPFYDNSFKIINYINNDNFCIMINENKNLKYKKEIEYKNIKKKIDKSNFINYKLKKNIIFKNDTLLNLFNINNNISDLIIKNYYNKNYNKKGIYINCLPYNFSKSFNSFNEFLKENYK